MRRNNTTRSESKEDPPLLLAGKRERPEEEKPNKCIESLCELLGTLFVITVLAIGLLLSNGFILRKMEPADGQTRLVSPSPSPVPTADDYSVAVQLLRTRFDKLKAKMPAGDQDSFGNELDQLDREVAFVARVEGELQQAFEQVRGKLRNLEEGTVTV